MSDGRSPFLAAVDRLDVVVKTIKAGQLAATGAPATLVDETPAFHPEEAWARRFGTHAIRPARDVEVGAPPFSAFVPPLAGLPQPPQRTPQPPVSGLAEARGHIGAGLGKPGPRRSWVARLFLGR